MAKSAKPLRKWFWFSKALFLRIKLFFDLNSQGGTFKTIQTSTNWYFSKTWSSVPAKRRAESCASQLSRALRSDVNGGLYFKWHVFEIGLQKGFLNFYFGGLFALSCLDPSRFIFRPDREVALLRLVQLWFFSWHDPSIILEMRAV